MRAEVIRADGVTRRFGSQIVLQDLAMTIRRGERVGLLGLNGAGKTTLFRCLLGLLTYEGDLQVGGVDVRTGGEAVRATIGYVPQRPPNFEGSLRELIEFFAALRSIDARAVVRRISDFDLSIERHGDKPVRALSGGMLQKTLLALAVAEEVPLLLLDEPTANLDPRAREDFVAGLRAVPASTTILLSSHRLDDIRAVTDRVVVLHGGRLAFDGGLGALYAASGHAPVLWLEGAPEHRQAMVRDLADDPRVIRVHVADPGVGLEARSADLVDLCAEVRRRGYVVREMRVEPPTLEALLNGEVHHSGSLA